MDRDLPFVSTHYGSLANRQSEKEQVRGETFSNGKSLNLKTPANK
jgi:hypothetical protein